MNKLAVIGMGCRFPCAPSPRDFWSLLKEGRNAISSSLNRGKHFLDFPNHLCRGGFIENSEQYSIDNFHISPRELKQMDPQQKLFLDVTQKSILDAGLDEKKLANSNTGVFVGVMSSDWGRLSLADLQDIDIHTGTGNGYCMIANRISYLYNLRGPSMAIDTACSSSLVAIDIAGKYLNSKEIDTAIVGGVNVILSPALNEFYHKAGLASKKGLCQSFGSEADGIVRAEGAGVVILKRLTDAISEQSKIYGVIHSSSVNHNGKGNGITAPNKWAQVEVIKSAVQKSGINPADIQYVEAHGTGTVLGDPIEANAIGDAIGKFKSIPCHIGSVKSNLGHLEGAAGIASLIKVLLSIQYEQIPPSLFFGVGNKHIHFKELNLSVVTEIIPWNEKKRFSGISSFGLGGTNSHIIVSDTDHIFLPIENIAEHIHKNIILILSQITEIPDCKISSTSQLLYQLGFDSLMMLELKNKIEKKFKIEEKIQINDLFRMDTVDDLERFVFYIYEREHCK